MLSFANQAVLFNQLDAREHDTYVDKAVSSLNRHTSLH